MDPGVVPTRVRRVALSPSHSSWSLLRPHLRLAADGFSLGAARSIYMGFLASVRDLRSREDCLQHYIFPHAAGGAPGGVTRTLHRLERPRQRLARNTHSHTFFYL